MRELAQRRTDMVVAFLGVGGILGLILLIIVIIAIIYFIFGRG